MLSKAISGYTEITIFENANLDASYFCNNCVYFINQNECTIAKNKGPDVNGEESGVISLVHYGFLLKDRPNKVMKW